MFLLVRGLLHGGGGLSHRGDGSGSLVGVEGGRR